MMKTLVITKIKANEGRKLFFKLRSSVSKSIEHGQFYSLYGSLFLLDSDWRLTIRLALVLNETQIQSCF